MANYFAYGSNMYSQRLCDRVPSATKTDIGYVVNYKFAINKISRKDGSAKGNIVLTENQLDRVYGVIFNIADTEIGTLDNFEGLGSGYNKIQIKVELENEISINCITYIADVISINNDLFPFDWYLKFIINGARQNELPTYYINQLQNFNSIIDTDQERINEAQRIMTI